MKRVLTGILATLCLASSAPARSPASAPTSRPATTRPASDDTTVGRVPNGALTRRFRELHEQYVDRVKQGNIDVVFFGDSITQKWHDAPDVWQSHYEPLKAVNFGINGNIIPNVLWRVENGELDGISPKVVVLLVGTNNSNRKDPGPVVTGIKHLIDVIHQKCPETKVLLLAIFPRDRPAEPNAKRIIDQVNPKLALLENGKSIRFLNINRRLLTPDGKLKGELFSDRLHLNPAGYQVWADAMQPLLDEMLGKLPNRLRE